MENFITGIPTTLVGWMGTIFVVILSGIYLVSRIRKNDMEVLRAANVDLRASLDDNSKELAQMRSEINTLMTKVSDLERQNKTFEDLIVVALKQFYFEHPEVANDLKGKLIK